MAQGFLIGLPQRLFDDNGDPAVGWKLSYVVAGTSTPVATYSNALLTSANSDPVVTDANGYFRVFVAEGVIVDIAVTDDADVPQFTFENIEAMPDTSGSSPSVTAVPTGGVIAWTTASAPTGFLLCDGSAVSRATYTDLNTLLSAASYPYGSGNGTTTFNVPNLVGKFPLGVAASGTGSTLGGTGGAIDHTHTGPSHTHTATVARDGWGTALNNPSTTGRLNVGDAAGVAPLNASYQPSADLSITTAAGGTGNTGTGNPPFLALYFIIKT